MSNMTIKVVSVEVDTATSKAGKPYEFVEVTYKNLTFEGKVEAKKHNQYGDKEVFRVLKNAKNGDVYTVTREKDDNGYWQWVGITAGESAGTSTGSAGTKATPASGGNPAPKSTYETAEERAKKQVYIVRQSSINAAIETLKVDKKAVAVEDVLATAKIYENYVFGITEVDGPQDLPQEDEDDDIPV